MVEPFHVELLAEAVAALVALAQLLVELRRHVVVAVQVDVAAHAHVLDGGQPDHVVEVVEDVLDRRGLLGPDEHPHPGDAHDAALRRHPPDRLVGLAARVPGHQ
jgi:hypothetical protein